MNTTPTEDQFADRKKQVLVYVGVSLAQYQKIERGLKMILPFAVKDGRKASDNPYSDMRDLLESKTTMGPLIEQLKKFSSSTDPEHTANYFRTVIDHRNELVHQFFHLPIGQMNNTEECREALVHLKSRMDYAQPLVDFVDDFAKSVVRKMGPAPE